MRGLVLLGATPQADVLGAATAACRAAWEQDLAVSAHVPVATGGSEAAVERLAEATAQELDVVAPRRYATAAAPLVAARHVGDTLEPQALLAAVAAGPEDVDLLVIAVAGGVLAPLTPRYAVRDLLREFELPVVVVAAAGPDALPVGRLTMETLRGARLPVPAFVLTGWPDPPDRVALDERALLADLTAASIHTLDASARWPLMQWAEATVAAPARTAAPSAQPAGEPPAFVPTPVLLEPYSAWEPTPTGDPRSTPRPRIMDALEQIVAAEGPMTASRAFALYNRASGGKKLTTAARTPLTSAAHWLRQGNRIVIVPRDEIPWQDDDVLRAPDAPEVRVRELGPRQLDEVPLDEVAELMRRLREARGGHADGPALKRAVLEAYGLTRLTAKADEYLGLALELLGD